MPEGRRVKVVLDLTSIIYGARAIRRNSRALAVELLRRATDIEYVLFYAGRSNRSDPRIALPACSPHRERLVRAPGRLLTWSWERWSWPPIEAHVKDVDLVFGTDLYFPPARRAVAATTLHGLAYITAPESMPPDQVASQRRGLAYARKESDCLVAVSEHTRRTAVERLGIPGGAIRVCPNAVDPAFRVIEDREGVAKVLDERWGIRGPYILYVGALTKLKNVLRAIEAFALVRERHPGLVFILVGPPENAEAEARALAAKKCPDASVRFLGPVPVEGDDLPYLYNGAEAFLFPSLSEGWTGPPLEAMACGVPVVTSNVSSLPETCGDAARYVDPLDLEAIARGVLDVLEDAALRADLIGRGLRRAAGCRWPRSAEILEGIFRDLVARVPGK
jgi:glycosyltransferase involved in cell wall biosynthesis